MTTSAYINCIVLDDEKPARDGLVNYISQVDFLKLKGVAKSAKEAKFLLETENVELVFCDIEMPQISGISFIKGLSKKPFTIFTTAFREFAVEGFELNAIDYLVKPISFRRFEKACQKALTAILKNSVKEEHLFIKDGTDHIKILINQITHLQSADDYVFIHLHSGIRHMVLMPLKELVKQLPGDLFIQTHRSHVINKSFVTSIVGNKLKLGDKTVPISRSRILEVKSRLLGEYL